MENYDFCFVSELSLIDSLQADDLFLVSQLSDGSSEHVSKSMTYSTLCSAVLRDIDGKVSASVSSHIADLSAQVYLNADNISALCATSEKTVSAVVKMANCIQQNKTDISSLSAKFNDFSGENGISVGKTESDGWRIGHTNGVSPEDLGFFKFSYDSNGHVLSSVKVDYADITGLGQFISGATGGVAADGQNRVYLEPAMSSTLGGVMIDNEQSSVTNVLVSETGVVSAVDTVYTAGTGLSLGGTEFTLLSSSANRIGGVKIDNNTSANNIVILSDGRLSARDTSYDTATSDKPGLIQIGFTQDDAAKKYPVQIQRGKAYVHVPWENTEYEFRTDTLSVPEFATVSSVHQQNGSVTELGYSTSIYDKLVELSVNSPAVTLSSCVKTGNGLITYQPDNNKISLYASVRDDESAMVSYTSINPFVTGGSVVSAKWVNIDGTEQKITEGSPYLMLNMTGATESSDNIFISLSPLVETIARAVNAG